jgi:hypothetical protein
LHDLTGENFKWDIEPAKLREWWEQHQSQFSPNVCHRLGKPIDLADFVDLLATDVVPERQRLLIELHIITGEDFGFVFDPHGPSEGQAEAASRAAERAQTWLRENAGKFEHGAVYKYGHKQNLEHIFDQPSARSSKKGGRRKSRSKS